MERAPGYLWSSDHIYIKTGERVLVAINADGEDYYAHFNAECGRAVDLITGKEHDFGGGSKLPPYTAYFWKCER